MLSRIVELGALYETSSERSQRSARLWGLPHSYEPDQPGLVLIQIDGLSRHELQRAIDGGYMPNLQRLIAREDHQIHDVYSGLPSTTPAAQGELFFGRKTAVPAFAFGDRVRGEVVDMLNADRAQSVEARLSAESPGLLQGGSCYCNIYGGGASESHFCATTLGWNGMFRNTSPLSLFLGVLWHVDGMVRIACKLVWESLLIAVDLMRGLVGRLELKREWEKAGSRLGIGVVMEELMTMSACIDVVRGLPIVQFNFLSYDERGHLRGPDSRFALRALRRVDAAIARVRRAALRSDGRCYSVWIYSDHGQERTVPYDDVAGRTFLEAVGLAFRASRASYNGQSVRAVRLACGICDRRASRDPWLRNGEPCRTRT